MRTWFVFALSLLLFGVRLASAVTLEQVISRENTGFDAASARLVAGRDGRVYLSHTNDPGYVISMRPDGSDRLGFAIGHANELTAVNTQGGYALRQGHFAHTAALFTHDGTPLTTFSDLNNDNYDAPQDIAVGASGDFYLLDGRTTNRVIRLSGTTGKLVAIYTLPKPGNMYYALQVSEAVSRFYLSDYAQPLKLVSFDGKVAATAPQFSPFTVADDGSFWMLPTRGSDTVTHYSLDGKTLGTVKLELGERKSVGDGLYFTWLGLLPGNELAVKRNHPYEQFARYDLTTGAFKGSVNGKHELLTVTYPSQLWTAGQATPLTIAFDGGGRATAPQWRVWITPFGASQWQQLPYDNGQVQVPASFGGLYQLKVSPEVARWQGGTVSEYLVHDVIEVRRPGSHGTLSVCTPGNRMHYGRGEAVAATVIARVAPLPAAATVELWADGAAKPLLTAPLPLVGKETPYTLPAQVTTGLRPGSYRLLVTAPDLTPVAQVLEIGPGLANLSTFRVMLHGDYGPTRPTGDIWTAADMTRAHLDWSAKNALNFFVDRFNFTFPLDWANSFNGRAYLRDLQARLEKDPQGTAPAKAELLFPDGETVAGYGAAGMTHMGLLVNMDGGLPLGTGFDTRTNAQFADNIVKHTTAMKSFPGWLGWDWVANWWMFDENKRLTNDDERKAYPAAWKKAEETGAWDPILETVADRGISWQVEAQQFFRETLAKVAPERLTASSGPYRRPATYSPLSFSNVEQIDLQYQAEQITTPYWTATAYDFYHRPGKPAWLHPEMWNDTGTGEQVLPMTWLALMRGTDGIGNSGFYPNWGQQPLDWRNGYQGLAGVYRTLFTTVAPLGPWLQTLTPRDQVALLISRRMLKIDPWSGIGGRYFTSQWEAYMSLLYAHTPAQWVYLEDVTPTTWKRFKAVVAVGQRVEPEPEWTAALKQARNAGLTIFADGSCRPEFVPDAVPLGVSFDNIEKVPSWNADASYWLLPEQLLANARTLAPVLAKALPPVAEVAAPEVLVSERVAGQGRFVWVVNNTHNPLPQELLYRVNVAVSSQLPVVTAVTVPGAAGKAVYDVFAHQPETPNAQGTLIADLRAMDAKLYAVLPKPIARLALRGPKGVTAGGTFPWAAWVQDAAGAPLDTNLPVRVTLRAGNEILAQRDTTAQAAAGATGTFTAPLDVTTLTLEATELIAGRGATLTIPVLPTAKPALDARGISATKTLPPAPFGARLRTLTVSADGGTAYLGAMQWGNNLYALDLAGGGMKWLKQVGQYWALGAQRFGAGVAVGGFDFSTAEGYHLYTVGPDGAASRRFAVYGLPTETPALFTITVAPNYPTLGFQAGQNGTWVAASGDLGVAVWAADGKKLWSLDAYTDGTRHTPSRLAVAGDVLLVIDGLRVRAFDAPTGRALWNLTLAVDGEVTQAKATPDGKTIALLTTVDGGRVFLLRDGKFADAVPVKGSEFDISSAGTTLAVTEGNALKVVQTNGGLLWSCTLDGPLHFPTFNADGTRLAVCSEVGTLLVTDRAGADRRTLDLGSVTQTAWLPGGDLLAASWLGTVTRYDGTTLVPRWSALLQPGGQEVSAAHLLAADATPTTRMTGWSNAAPPEAPIPAALPGRTTVSLERDGRAFETVGNPNAMTDGKLDAPMKPYLALGALNPHNGNGARTAIVLERGKNLVRLAAITFYEDEKHPESWLRDVELQVWDAQTRVWQPVQRLLSDAAVHTHVLAQPVEGSRFRVLLPPFPNSNIRLKEITLGGEDLGPAYPPDVRAKKAVAVLFDDNIADLLGPYQNGFNMGFQPKNAADAYSGAAYFIFDPAKNGGLAQCRPMADVDTWLHPLAENPQPGQYRWLQMAVKRLSPDLKQLKLWLGHPDTNPFVVIPIKPTDDWQLVRVDLWALQKRPMTITKLWLAFETGPCAVDQIVLGRTEADLDGVKPVKQ